MAGINKAIIIGNLGQDVELRYTQDGNPIANFSVATSDNWTDKNTGEKKSNTEWHRIAIFGKLAEVANQYLHKGSKVYIEGRLQTRKWQDNQGADRYSTEIIVSGFGSTLQMLDKRGESDTTTATEPPKNTGQNQTQTPAQNPQETVQPLEQPDDFEDDIPF